MRRISSNVLLAVSTVVAAAGLTRTAHADPQEQQLAQALFEEGRRLMDQKKYPEACPKLAESQRLDPGGGTLLNLAICHEKEGKLATAQVDYNEALALATRDSRQDRQKIARERIAAIDRLVPRLTIVVAHAASEIEGLELKLDGLVLRRAAWGVATPVDPGTHVVEANATGRTPWSGTIVVEVAQKKSIEVPVILPLSQLPVGGGLGTSREPHAPVDIVGTIAPRSGPPAVYVEQPGANYYQRATPTTTGPASPVFYTALAITLVAGTTSAITGYLALSENASAKEGCLPDRRYCRNQSSIDAAGSSASFAVVSTVSLGVTAVGVVALLVFPSHLAGSRTVGAAAIPGGAVFDLHGEF